MTANPQWPSRPEDASFTLTVELEESDGELTGKATSFPPVNARFGLEEGELDHSAVVLMLSVAGIEPKAGRYVLRATMEGAELLEYPQATTEAEFEAFARNVRACLVKDAALLRDAYRVFPDEAAIGQIANAVVSMAVQQMLDQDPLAENLQLPAPDEVAFEGGCAGCALGEHAAHSGAQVVQVGEVKVGRLRDGKIVVGLLGHGFPFYGYFTAELVARVKAALPAGAREMALNMLARTHLQARVDQRASDAIIAAYGTPDETAVRERIVQMEESTRELARRQREAAAQAPDEPDDSSTPLEALLAAVFGERQSEDPRTFDRIE